MEFHRLLYTSKETCIAQISSEEKLKALETILDSFGAFRQHLLAYLPYHTEGTEQSMVLIGRLR